MANSGSARCSRLCRSPSTPPMPTAGSRSTTRRPSISPGASPRSVPMHGASPGSCTGLTAHPCRTTNVRWQSRSRSGVAVRGAEAIAERPDGTRVRFQPHPTPLFDASGRLVGGLNMLVDLTERHQAEVQSALIASIVASSEDAIISKTLEGRITSWNAGATRIFGYEADEMIGQSIKRLIPPELHAEEDRILAQVKRGDRLEHYDTIRTAKDGRRIDISLTVSPVRDKSGNIVGASKVGRDVTERKHVEKLHLLLLAELSHRVKNTLATVQAIANQTVRQARSPGEFAASFSGRLQALARTHTLLTDNTWQGADALPLIREQVLLGEVDDRADFLFRPFRDARPPGRSAPRLGAARAWHQCPQAWRLVGAQWAAVDQMGGALQRADGIFCSSGWSGADPPSSPPARAVSVPRSSSRACGHMAGRPPSATRRRASPATSSCRCPRKPAALTQPSPTSIRRRFGGTGRQLRLPREASACWWWTTSRWWPWTLSTA